MSQEVLEICYGPNQNTNLELLISSDATKLHSILSLTLQEPSGDEPSLQIPLASKVGKKNKQGKESQSVIRSNSIPFVSSLEHPFYIQAFLT